MLYGTEKLIKMILFVYIESLVKMIDNILMEVVEKNPFNS